MAPRPEDGLRQGPGGSDREIAGRGSHNTRARRGRDARTDRGRSACGGDTADDAVLLRVHRGVEQQQGARDLQRHRRGHDPDDDIDCAQRSRRSTTIQGAGRAPPSPAPSRPKASSSATTSDRVPRCAASTSNMRPRRERGHLRRHLRLQQLQRQRLPLATSSTSPAPRRSSRIRPQISLASTPTLRLRYRLGRPTDVTLPFATPTFLERYEGMLVRMHQTLFVTEHFQLGRFGEVLLSSGGRLQAADERRRAGRARARAPGTEQPEPDPPRRHAPEPEPRPDRLRALRQSADRVEHAARRRHGGRHRRRDDVHLGGERRERQRLPRPPDRCHGRHVPRFMPSNPRPASPPAVGGSLRVVGMNLLNFFNTFTGCTNGAGGAATGLPRCDNAGEFDRQWPKTVAAILAMNPDVIGINEIENDGYGPTSAIQFLVDKLNQATVPGTFAFIDVDTSTAQVNAMGTDAIKVGDALQTRRGHTRRPDGGAQLGRVRQRRRLVPAQSALARAGISGERHRRTVHRRREPSEEQGQRLRRARCR